MTREEMKSRTTFTFSVSNNGQRLHPDALVQRIVSMFRNRATLMSRE